MTNEATGFDSAKKNVLICDTQPVAVEGMKWLIETSGDLHFVGSVPTLDAVYMLLNPEAAKLAAAELAAELAAVKAAAEMEAQLEAAKMEALLAPVPEPESLEIDTSEQEQLEPEAEVMVEAVAVVAGDAVYEDVACGSELCVVEAPTSRNLLESLPAVPETAETVSEPEPAAPPIPIDAVVIDKGLGLAGVMELLHKLTSTSHPTPTVVWGAAISESEALRLLQAGARGILRRTSDSDTLLTCLRAVTKGGTWMEDGIFGSTEKLFNPRRSQLTHRESEVVVLVEKGFRNRDIARMLGIQTGTVKIHLKHIFEKTGVRGRYGLAFTGLQNKGTIAMTAPPQFTA